MCSWKSLNFLFKNGYEPWIYNFQCLEPEQIIEIFRFEEIYYDYEVWLKDYSRSQKVDTTESFIVLVIH